MASIDPRVHVDHVALRVSDVARSAAFYALVGGLEIREQDTEHAALGAPAGGRPILRLRRAPDPGAAQRRATGLFHSAFLFEGRAGLGAALQRIAEARIPLSGASDHGVSEALYLDDPDGLGLELYRDRSRDHWPPAATPGERVAMFTGPLDVRALLSDAGPDAGRVTLGHAHLKVSDLDAAVRFWVDGMGLELMQHFGGAAAFVAAGGYHHHLGMNAWHSLGAPPEDLAAPGLDHVALGYPDDEALADANARLAAAGPVPDAIGVELVLAQPPGSIQLGGHNPVAAVDAPA
jgi:catechol 2,3-dioxygenase